LTYTDLIGSVFVKATLLVDLLGRLACPRLVRGLNLGLCAASEAHDDLGAYPVATAGTQTRLGQRQ